MLVNQFAVTPMQFLNRFSSQCEEKLRYVSEGIYRVNGKMADWINGQGRSPEWGGRIDINSNSNTPIKIPNIMPSIMGISLIAVFSNTCAPSFPVDIHKTPEYRRTSHKLPISITEISMLTHCYQTRLGLGWLHATKALRASPRRPRVACGIAELAARCRSCGGSSSLHLEPASSPVDHEAAATLGPRESEGKGLEGGGGRGSFMAAESLPARRWALGVTCKAFDVTPFHPPTFLPPSLPPSLAPSLPCSLLHSLHPSLLFPLPRSRARVHTYSLPRSLAPIRVGSPKQRRQLGRLRRAR